MIKSSVYRLLLSASSSCHRCSSNPIILNQIQSSKKASNIDLNSSSTRQFGSKTPSKSGLATATKTQSTSDPNVYPMEIDSSDKISFQNNSSTSTELTTTKKKRKRREVLRMDESEYADAAILQPKLPLMDRRGEFQSHYFKAFAPDRSNSADVLSLFHGDWDFRPIGIKRWWGSVEAEFAIKQQEYKPKRNSVLGHDLSTAHFVVFRKGRVRFQGQTEWVSQYRKDATPGVTEDDLPAMRFDLCTLPVNYDPRFRLEAIDCTGVPLLYEGLLNFQNLNFVKWLSFKDSPHLDDWCLDRITRLFYETIEHVDLSGCPRVTDRGIGALSKCKKLKTLVVENMSHVKHLEIVCALLEDLLPELEVIGVDYAAKTEQLRIEGEQLELKAKETAEALEANTITVEPKYGPGPDPFINEVEKQRNSSSS